MTAHPVMTRRWRPSLLAALVAAAATAILVQARPAWSHQLHTTLTEVAVDSSDGTLRITIRAFADDFSAAVARHAGQSPPTDHNVDAAPGAAYISAMISMTDASGRRVPMSWRGLRRTGDLLWITMRVPSVRSPRGVKIGCAMLFEMFDDEVNIVQASADGLRRSMLFTKGDGLKVKPLF